jgi:hypothetical protein
MPHVIETRIHRARAHLYRLQLVQDCDPMPPWDGDCLPPIAYISGGDRGRSITEHTGKGERIMPSLTGATPDQLRKMADELRMDWDTLVQEAADYEGIDDAAYFLDEPKPSAEKVHEFVDGPLFDRIADLLSESLSDSSGSRSDHLEAIAAIWRILGVNADVFASNGYSQSNWAEILVILHPAWIARVGWTGDDEAARKTMKAVSQEIGAYFLGDVVGYVVERIDPNELELADLDPDTLTESEAAGLAYGDVVGECWGFYPDLTTPAPQYEYVWAEAIAEADADAESLDEAPAAA